MGRAAKDAFESRNWARRIKLKSNYLWTAFEVADVIWIKWEEKFSRWIACACRGLRRPKACTEELFQHNLFLILMILCYKSQDEVNEASATRLGVWLTVERRSYLAAMPVELQKLSRPLNHQNSELNSKFSGNTSKWLSIILWTATRSFCRPSNVRELQLEFVVLLKSLYRLLI